jgi:hypothetical protein
MAERLQAHARLCEQIAETCASGQTADCFALMARECAETASRVIAAHALPRRLLQ